MGFAYSLQVHGILCQLRLDPR